jgi:hypothetical protein
MFEIDYFTSNIINPIITDSGGTNFWVGQAVVTAEPPAPPLGYSEAFSAAWAAGCPAARLVEQLRACTRPLVRLVFAEALRQGKSIRELAAQLRVTHGYINQLNAGTRRADQISDDFSRALSEVLQMPRLLVLFVAGRLTVGDLEELDTVGVAAAEHMTEMADLVQRRADDVLAWAATRIEEEEALAGPKRQLTPLDAEQLLEEAEQGAQFEMMRERHEALIQRLQEVAGALQVA